MSLIGLFTQNRPNIGGFYFDAILEESSELLTDVTEFPIESGAIGNDHAVQRPLTLIMRVGISDNPSRALRQQAGDVGGPVAGNLFGAAAGSAISGVSENVAIAAGLSASLANAAYSAGQASVRSQSVLDEIRFLQRSNSIITVVASKRAYENVMITGTRQETNKENEQGLELVVEMQEMLTVRSPLLRDPIPARNDPAQTQAQPSVDLGLVVPQ